MSFTSLIIVVLLFIFLIIPMIIWGFIIVVVGSATKQLSNVDGDKDIQKASVKMKIAGFSSMALGVVLGYLTASRLPALIDGPV